jgi:hypothetical protein
MKNIVKKRKKKDFFGSKF